MWNPSHRQQLWQSFSQPWDIVIIGGGVTGAGILREAVRLGLKALLVEQRDFAWGTSSRSSKLVHGGLRYLQQGKFGLTRASVQEREHLLHEAPGLIDPLGFLLTVHKGDFPGRWTYEVGLTVYDLLALRWDHHYYSPADFQLLAPRIAARGLQGGFRFGDAQTDDARLVLRLLREAGAAGGALLNYVKAEELLFDSDKNAIGLRLRDCETGQTADVYARAIVNATGAWADQLRSQLGAPRRIRPLRGSHLIFPQWRLPVAQAVSFLHTLDRRPVFIFPWEGVTLVGTTDVDCQGCPDEEPAISAEETAYLLAAVEAQFPSLNIGLDDVISTYAGVRPVIDTGKEDPSRESREHVLWDENGLLTVTGGKLTTFRLIAHDALNALRARLPEIAELDSSAPVLDRVDTTLAGGESLAEGVQRRLLGRYGADAARLVACAQAGELEVIPGSQTLWAELRWAARAEAVLRLDDLLLRRTRLGLLLPKGGAAILPRVAEICRAELGWDEKRWRAEETAYREIQRRCYDLPERAAIPDWKAMITQATEQRRLRAQRRRRSLRRLAGFGLAAAAALAAMIAILKRRHHDQRPSPRH